MTIITSNMYLGADNPGIKTGIDVLKNESVLPDGTLFTNPVTSHGITRTKKMKYYFEILDHLKEIHQSYIAHSEKGEKNILIGGDHSIAIASGVHSLENYDNLGVVWVDAHADINTNDITNSGNVHGMSVAALLGLGDDGLVNFVPRTKYLKPENVVYIGLRDVEPEEQALLDKLRIKHYTADEVMSLGIETVMKESIAHLKAQKVKNLHLSYDLDSADPTLVPGVTTDVPNGLDLKQTLYIFRQLHKAFNVVAFDLVEFNPEKDVDNQTVDFIKQIMPDVLK
ncbi:arginase [Vagococcus carniphilus]|uniref:Arginase n=1 Tax=Vagococcus carniphilus TaxID=218144 RepID=A0A430AQ09_9ENTE|nr:arginase [Vagococcus carniphilus]QNN72552.1 arginase [Vagococcus carniphilus]RSU10208.1 hypothetical protein CBF28_14025 [Vagococcus carniphilus]